MTGALSGIIDAAAYAALKAAFGAKHRGHYRRFIEATKNPEGAQETLLKRILSANAETLFAQRHHLAQVRNIEDFRKAVPAQGYEDLRSLIERQELTREPCLTVEQPVYYHRTSGTLGAPKNIPVTQSGLKAFRRHQQISSYVQLTGTEIFRGRVFAIMGQEIEGYMAGGTPFGSASGLLYANQSRFVRSRYVLPMALSDIDDYEQRYLAMAIYGLADRSVSCVATANPSTLIRLLSIINDNLDRITAAIASGRLPEQVSGLAPGARPLRPDRGRARQLEEARKRKALLGFGDIWPQLRGVVTWTSGSCAVPLHQLEGLLPETTQIVELGYLASELRGTVNIDVRRGLCLPTLQDNLFEFVERADWEAGSQTFLSLHELDEGGEYYVFVTTPDGLYRYDMNDILRVTGKMNATPALAFVQKGKGVTNITGEKLSESQVLAAVMQVGKEQNLQAKFFVMLADHEDARYTLYLERHEPGGPADAGLSAALDRNLRALNIEYDAKRESGRLRPLNLRSLQPGAGDLYRRACVAAGQRDAQFKVQHLQYAHECTFDFESAVRSP